MKIIYQILLAVVLVAAECCHLTAQTRNVPIKCWEADSIECANIGNKKFHSAIRSFAADPDVSPKYALQSVRGKRRWTLEPLAEFGVGTQSEYSSNYYTAMLGASGTYSLGKKLTVSLSVYGGYLSPLGSVAALADSLNRFPQMDGYSDKGDGKYMARGVDFYVSYRPADYLSLTAGKGKKFVGDGYRSVIMSASNSGMYYFDTEVEVGNFKYMFSVNGGKNFDNGVSAKEATTQMVEPAITDGWKFRTVYMINHLFSYNPAKWLNIGGFETVMMIRRDSTNRTRMPDLHYMNPMLFFRPLEFSLGSPDNALMGAFGKITINKYLVGYAQFMLDDFNFEQIKEHNDTWNNKYAYQLGVKGFAGGFSYLLEYNYIRPYIYSHDRPLNSYSLYGQPLAHPYGANLKEAVVNLKYKMEKFDFDLLFDYIKRGMDYDIYSYGNNVLRPYTSRHHNTGNVICQGLGVKNLLVTLDARWCPDALRNFCVFARVGVQHSDDFNNTFAMIGIKTSKLFFDRTL
ncbi:MAG: hypothetical protein K6F33_15415 [Bacteroidales bacterium]|nr:hypothetical protein [Bacteroidales bacterium]